MAAAASTDVEVAFDSTGLAAGEYNGLLCIASNDPNQQTVPVAVTLTVTDSSTPPVQEVTASDGTPGDEFGISVVVEGDTAIVGAAYENSGQGAVYVFTQANGVWSEAQKLTASDGAANDWFGQSVALDGDTAVVGAPQYLNVGNGAAYVFTRSGTTWSAVQNGRPTMASRATSSVSRLRSTVPTYLSVPTEPAFIPARRTCFRIYRQVLNNPPNLTIFTQPPGFTT